MAGQIFHVLTEFRFETGAAILGTEKLQEAVEGVSSAADGALMSFQKMGLGLVAQLGLGGGGLLGILGKSIQSFDKFKQSQLALANVMGTAADPFERKMSDAADVMARINKLANEFALPADELLAMTKVLGPMLNAKTDKQGRSLAGPGFSTAVDMGRNLLKSAPTLGVDPGLVQGQMLRMIEGQASMGDTLFTRLISDTKAMGQFREKGSKGFNALEAADRVKILSKALKEFASDSRILEANVNTLRGQFTLFQNSIMSSLSILRPLGEALLVPIIQVFKGFNAYLAKQGAEIFKQLGRGLGPLIKDPEQLIATLMQLRDLKADVNSATKIVGVAGAILGAGAALSFLGIQIPIITSGLAMFSKMILAIEGPIKALTIGAGAGGALNSIVMLVTRIAGPILLLVGLFQLLSRAIAIARINDAKAIAELLPKITEIGATFARIFDVFNEGFGKIAELIAPMFQVSGWLELFINLLDGVATGITLVMAGFQGLIFGILEMVNQVQSLFTGGGFSGAAIMDAFSAGTEQMIERILGKVDSGEGGTSGQVVNINKVEIRNDFKEQQQPDRIAFSLKEQLLKAAQNPTQRRGGSFQSATVGR